MQVSAYAEDLGILYCFLTNWDAAESSLWHNILNRVWLSAPSLPLEDLKSSTNSRVCQRLWVEKKINIISSCSINMENSGLQNHQKIFLWCFDFGLGQLS